MAETSPYPRHHIFSRDYKPSIRASRTVCAAGEKRLDRLGQQGEGIHHHGTSKFNRVWISQFVSKDAYQRFFRA
ncbi:hypothetical protein RRF57_003631 [Xylaria bambusicola]|uniref:Uncharacterized protein n=1 Tax=Xylaria bambusicola TaxID=326684 RepID=A0AAN7UKI3_9PEZI